MKRLSFFCLATTAALCGMAGLAQAAEVARYDAATGQLRLPLLQLEAGVRLSDVVLQPARSQVPPSAPPPPAAAARASGASGASGTPGTPGASSSLAGALSLQQQLLQATAGGVRLPQVVVEGTVYPHAGLTQSGLMLLSVGAMEVDTGGRGGQTLRIAIQEGDAALAPITVLHTRAPASREQFCADPSVLQTVTRSSGGTMAGQWRVVDCQFEAGRGHLEIEQSAAFLSNRYRARFEWR